jgi:hypothetical protein
VSTEPNVGDALEAERTHLLRLLVEALMTMPPTISLGHKAVYFPDERGVGLPQRIAAAIRARGETPPARRPGEIDWSAMDKD